MEKAEFYHCMVQEAKEYLLSFDKVTEEIIEKYLEHYKEDNPNSLEGVLEGILKSARNRTGMGGIENETIERLKPYLNAFYPKVIVENYKDDSTKVFKKIRDKYKLRKSEPEMNNKSGNPWHELSETIIDSARFLLQFKNYEDFHETASYFNNQKDLEIQMTLPHFIRKRVHGLRFTLACDFLKENGYPNYIKPDRVITRIFTEFNISETENEYSIFRDVINFSRTIDELPYKVDKLLWLVGSDTGFYLHEDINVNTDISEFIDRVQSTSGYG